MKKITYALALPIFYLLFTGSAYALIDCEKNAQLPHPLPWCSSPIIIDTDGKGFHLTSARNGVLFDIAGDGHLVQMAWTAAGSTNAFLALPHNGEILTGKEGQALGNDVWRVVGAMLERGPREQPAPVPRRRPAGAAPHPRSSRAHGRSGRPPGLVACSAGSRPAQTRLRPPSRRPSPPAPYRGQPGRARVRPGPDTPGRPGRARSAAPRDRAAAHRSRCAGCRSARRSARPESPCRRPGARSSVLALLIS